MQKYGTILTYVSKGDGGSLTPPDTRRSDALYIAAKKNNESAYKVLNKGKPILYVKWSDSMEQAPLAQMGSPSLFRKAKDGYGLVASENNKGTHIYLWDSDDLLTFRNERRVLVNTEGLAVEHPRIVYDETSANYQLFWKTRNGQEAYVSIASDHLTSFAIAEQHDYPDCPIAGIMPDNADVREACEFAVTKSEYDRFIQKYAPVVNVGIEQLDSIILQSGQPLPPLADRIELTYSDGSTKKLGVCWNEDDLRQIDLSKPGAYPLNGTVVQTVFSYPFIPERADPFITFNEDDGYYYATGSYYPESDPSTWSEAAMGKVDYDRVTLRRAKSLKELRIVEEFDIWVPRGEDGFVPFLWAPEIHKINGKWYILVGAKEGESGRDWCSTMVLVEYTGSIEDMQDGGMLNTRNWKPIKLEDSPCSFDMTFAEINGVGYYIWPNQASLYIQKVDPIDPAKRIGKAVKIKELEWPFEYGKHNINNSDQGIVEGAAILQYKDNIYLSYAGATVDKYYCTAVMTAKAGTDIMNPDSWTHPTYAGLSSEDVMKLEGDQAHCGPGHNSFSLDEYGNPIIIYHARPYPDPHTGRGVGGLHDPCRHTVVKSAHVAYDGTLILNMTPEEEVLPIYKNIIINVIVAP